MEKEITEIHKTEFVDREIPTIFYEKTTQDDMTCGKKIVISVSDVTSKDAFRTFKDVLKETDNGKQ